MKIAWFAIWVFVGLLTLSSSERISEASYFCVWIALLLNLLK